MTLKGDLGSMDLTHVSQMLSMNQKEGLLRIYQEGESRKRFILFTRKGITAYPVRGPDDPEVLAHILRRKNLMGRDVDAARKRFERPDKPLFQALLEMGLVGEDEARALIRDRVAEDLYEFFFLKNANGGGGADLVFGFGPTGAGIEPLVGDYDGNGTDTVGIYVGSTGAWFLKNANSGGNADVVFSFSTERWRRMSTALKSTSRSGVFPSRWS